MDVDDYVESTGSGGGSILSHGLTTHLDEKSLLRVPRMTLPTPSEKTRGLFIERARRRLREEMNVLWGVSYTDRSASTGELPPPLPPPYLHRYHDHYRYHQP